MLRVGTFQPLTSTTGAAAAEVAKCAVRVRDSPGHSVTSLSLHRIGSIGSPPAVRFIDTCLKKATALAGGGTVRVTGATSSAPSCRIGDRTSLVTSGKDCNR